MNASGTASILSFPSCTYCATRSGKTVSSNWPQNGHWRSMYSISVAGAFALPRTLPFCGTPSSSLCTCDGLRQRQLVRQRPGGRDVPSEEEPPANATPRPMPSAASTTTAPTAIRTLRSARRSGRRPRPRLRRLHPALALAARHVAKLADGFGLPEVERRQQQEHERQREAGQRERRDRHVAELVDPLRRAAAGSRDQATLRL